MDNLVFPIIGGFVGGLIGLLIIVLWNEIRSRR